MLGYTARPRKPLQEGGAGTEARPDHAQVRAHGSAAVKNGSLVAGQLTAGPSPERDSDAVGAHRRRSSQPPRRQEGAVGALVLGGPREPFGRRRQGVLL